jgi:hypothetical protein
MTWLKVSTESHTPISLAKRAEFFWWVRELRGEQFVHDARLAVEQQWRQDAAEDAETGPQIFVPMKGA